MEINKIHQGDSMELMRQLDDNSVDVCITSPPYWGLRDYGVDGQMGLEEHPQQYLDKMVGLWSVLKQKLSKTGSFYLNIGDTYFGSNQGYGQKEGQGSGIQNAVDGYFASSNRKPPAANKNIKSNWLQPKQLMGMPWRMAAMMQDDGWILRNDIIWHKPNPMPSSVTDRLNNTFEHIFHFVKSKKYYYDLDSIREEHKSQDPRGDNRTSYNIKSEGQNHTPSKNAGYLGQTLNGKNPGDCWDITTKPYPEAHFATFPPEILVKPLKSSCPDGGIVLDPFMGSGTVAMVCKYPGKFGIKKHVNYIGFELNEEYIRLANRRLSQSTLLSMI